MYLDNCALQRPLDGRRQTYVVIEAEAILGVFTLCDSGKVELVSSDGLVFEAQNNPNLTRKSAEKAGVDYFCTCDYRFLKKAKKLGNLKVKGVSPLELIKEIEE